MIKYFISAIVSLAIAILSALTISNYHKDKWEMNLFYTHVINTYNVDYKILDIDLELNSKNEFLDFINRMDGEISIVGANKNACAEIRASSTAPSILVMNRNDKLRIDIISYDKDQVLECEKVINKIISNFENYIKQIIIQKMSLTLSSINDKNVNLQELIANEKQRLKIQPEVEEAYDKLRSTLSQINKNDDFYSFNVAKTKQILEGMYTIEKMKRDAEFMGYSFRIDAALQDIIIQEGRLMKSKEQNSFSVGISIFIILQAIFMMIMIYKNDTLRNKVKKTIKKLS